MQEPSLSKLWQSSVIMSGPRSSAETADSDLPVRVRSAPGRRPRPGLLATINRGETSPRLARPVERGPPKERGPKATDASLRRL